MGHLPASAIDLAQTGLLGLTATRHFNVTQLDEFVKWFQQVEDHDVVFGTVGTPLIPMTHALDQSMSHKRCIGTSPRSRRGIAATELAVCLPLLVVLLFGTLETCATISLGQTLSIAAYEAARVALILGANETNIRTQCEQVLADRHVTGAVIQIAPAGFETAPPGTFVAVEISAPYATNGLLPVALFAKPYTTKRVEMMKEFQRNVRVYQPRVLWS